MPTPTYFEQSAHPGQADGHMTVQRMLRWFANNVYDKFVGKFVHGTATVPATATTVVVTHNLGSTTYQVILQQLLNLSGTFWVSNKTSSQFTINLSVAAPTGGATFDWFLKGA